MQVSTGDIVNLGKTHGREEMLKNGFAPLEEEDVPKVRKMNKNRRKNWMKNKPCPCGSGKKFKKCCWSKCGGS